MVVIIRMGSDLEDVASLLNVRFLFGQFANGRSSPSFRWDFSIHSSMSFSQWGREKELCNFQAWQPGLNRHRCFAFGELQYLR